MHNSSRAIGRQGKRPRVESTVARRSSPLVEPSGKELGETEEAARPGANGTNGTNGAAGADGVSTLAGPSRAIGMRGLTHDAHGSGPGLAAPPPLAEPPAHFTPLVLFLTQTLLDMLAMASAFSLAYWVRFYSDIIPRFVQPDPITYATMLVVTLATIIMTFYFSKLYHLRRGASRVDEFYRTAGAVSMGTVLSLATNSLILGDRFIYSRQILLMGWLLAILFVTVGRLTHGFVLGQLRKRGVDRARVLIVGTGATAAMVTTRLRQHDTLGYEVVGLINDANGAPAASAYFDSVPVLGDLGQIQDVVRRNRVDEVIVALAGASGMELRELIERLQDESVSIKVYPDAFQLMTENEVSVGELSGLPLLSVKDVALTGWNRRVKRAFDLAFSATMLVLLSPLLLLIALAVKLSSPGPVFFIQERVGLDGKPFPLVKFRTMRVEGDQGVARRFELNRPGWTVPDDPRRTPIGAFLRRFSLDEFPQFYNVLVGEMSIVGPRPEQPHYVEEFAQVIPRYAQRHREKSGITGWAQVNGFRGDTSIKVRTDLDVYYVNNWSLLFDLKIIASTVRTMITGNNAY